MQIANFGGGESQDLINPSVIQGVSPELEFKATTQGGDLKLWDINVTNTTFAIRTRTDADGAGTTAWAVTRTPTTTVSVQAWTSTTFQWSIGSGSTVSMGQNGAGGSTHLAFDFTSSKTRVFGYQTTGFVIGNAAAGPMELWSNGVQQWNLLTTGELQPQTDNVLAIGDTTHRVSSIYFAGTAFGGSFSALAAGSIGWAGQSLLTSASDGVIMLSNAAQSNFARLQFGGTTASFPALRRNGTAVLQARVADDSAYGQIQALAFIDDVEPLGVIGASATIDVTKAMFKTLTSTASTNMTLTPSAAGTAGMLMTIVITSDATGGVVVTFGSTFKSIGPMTLTASKKHTIVFKSDATNLCELSRTTGL